MTKWPTTRPSLLVVPVLGRFLEEDSEDAARKDPDGQLQQKSLHGSCGQSYPEIGDRKASEHAPDLACQRISEPESGQLHLVGKQGITQKQKVPVRAKTYSKVESATKASMRRYEEANEREQIIDECIKETKK